MLFIFVVGWIFVMIWFDFLVMWLNFVMIVRLVSVFVFRDILGVRVNLSDL